MSAAAHPTGPRHARTLSDQSSDDETRRSESVMAGGAGAGDGDDDEKAPRPSFSQMDPGAGFAQIDGDVGGTGYNETTADIVTVPCPGAHPIETWARDPFPVGYFGAPDADGEGHPAIRKLAGDAPLNPGIDRPLPKTPHIWVRQGIRKFVNTARVVLYRHRELDENTDLVTLADDLLEHVLRLREGQVGFLPSCLCLT